MLILAFESSAKSASVALLKDGKLAGQYFQNSGLTHSRTLLPMAEDLLRNSELKMSDIDIFAVATGPGSFTGIRIGVSTVKGLAWALEKPVCGVSTLEAMANLGTFAGENALICSAMDARRDQVYNALFEVKNGKIVRLCEDRAIAISELFDEIVSMEKQPFFIGDGAVLCNEYFSKNGKISTLTPEIIQIQNAYGVAVSAMTAEPITAEQLLPVYLRKSQAEREREERNSKI